MPYFMERERTTSTPYVLIDEGKGYMKMEGKSFNENVAEFYKEIQAWLENYLKTDFGKFTFDFKLDYFNSSTVKSLLNMLMKMDNKSTGGNKVVVNWMTTEDNDIVIECGEDFQEDVQNLEFNLMIE